MLSITRREMLARLGAGLGTVGLATVLHDGGLLAAEGAARNPLAPKPSHFRPRAKRLIHLFMNGGPSQVDTFDPKPALDKYNGQKPSTEMRTERKTGTLMKSPFRFAKHGRSGLEISDLFPHLAKCADDLCVIRSIQVTM